MVKRARQKFLRTHPNRYTTRGGRNVYRAAAPRTLGARERTHRSPPPVKAIVIFLVIFAAPGIAMMSGFQSAPGQVFAGDRLTNGAIGAVLLGFAAYASFFALRKATLSVTVHENGLRWIERGAARNVFWEDIASITGAHTSRRVAGEEIARTNVHHLTLDDGRVLVMTNMLADVASLAERVERTLMARLLPRGRVELAAGKRVTFGPVTLTKDAIESGTKVVPLPARVVVEDGMIEIGEGDTRIDVEWAKVPNARVLLALLDPSTS